MAVLIPAALAGCVPALMVFFWLRAYPKKDPAYRKACGYMLRRGMLAAFPIILLSGVSFVLIRLTGVQNSHALLYGLLYNFVVLAFCEELVKFLAFRGGIRKKVYPYSWLDMTVLMTIAAMGFGLLESIVYLFESGVGIMLVRGITIPHGGYGVIIGYFYGKSLKEHRRAAAAFGFALAWLIHGLYDFSLSEEAEALNSDVFAFIAVMLAVIDLILIIVLIVFVVKARKNEKYTMPLEADRQQVLNNMPDEEGAEAAGNESNLK